MIVALPARFSVDSQKYFGVPVSNIEAAKQHQLSGRKRLNVRVPSRGEVKTMAPQELRFVLIAWMTRSAIEIIPSRTQIYEVLQVLKSREDFHDIADIAELCQNYIVGD